MVPPKTYTYPLATTEEFALAPKGRLFPFVLQVPVDPSPWTWSRELGVVNPIPTLPADVTTKVLLSLPLICNCWVGEVVPIPTPVVFRERRSAFVGPPTIRAKASVPTLYNPVLVSPEKLSPGVVAVPSDKDNVEPNSPVEEIVKVWA